MKTFMLGGRAPRAVVFYSCINRCIVVFLITICSASRKLHAAGKGIPKEISF